MEAVYPSSLTVPLEDEEDEDDDDDEDDDGDDDEDDEGPVQKSGKGKNKGGFSALPLGGQGAGGQPAETPECKQN